MLWRDMKTPELSVIIPAFNCADCIGACLDSVFYQANSQNLDVIVINDGSTDKTRTIVSRYQDIYPNITLINQRNAGVSAARNMGIEVAGGKYITFVDADDTVGVSAKYVKKFLDARMDYVHWSDIDGLQFRRRNFDKMPEFKPVYERAYFTRMLHMANMFNADVALGGKATLNTEDKYISSLGYHDQLYSGPYAKQQVLRHADKRESANFALYRRDFLNQTNLRFEQSMPLDEDILFTMLAVLRAKSVITVPKSTYLYNRYRGTASNFHDTDQAKYKYAIATIQRLSVLMRELGTRPEWAVEYNEWMREFARIGRDAPIEYQRHFANENCLGCPCDTCGDCAQRRATDRRIAENIQMFLHGAKSRE